MKMLESFLIHYSRKSEHTLDSYERTIKNAMSRIIDKLENGSSIYELFKNIS